MGKKKNRQKRKNRQRGGCGGFFWGLTLVFVFTRIVLLLARQATGLANVFTVFPSAIVIGPLAVIWLICLLLNRGRALMTGVLAGGLFFLGGLNLPWRLMIPKDTRQVLTVGTWNVYMGALGPNGVLEALKANPADIWSLQEASKWRLGPGIDKKRAAAIVGGAGVVVGDGETVIVSRLPVSRQKMEHLDGQRNIVAAKVRDHGGPVWVVAVHYGFTGVGERRLIPRAVKMVTSGKRFLEPSMTQTDTLEKFLAGLDAPAIVVGDFNGTPLMPPAQRLRKGYTDAFLAAGWGFGYTFNRRLPLIRIDYIWAPKDSHRVAALETKFTPYSDHAMLLARLSRK